MTPDEQAEGLALMDQMNAYFDSLIVAGVSEQMVICAATSASTTRLLRSAVPTTVAAWLHGQALHVEAHGAALKAALG